MTVSNRRRNILKAMGAGFAAMAGGITVGPVRAADAVEARLLGDGATDLGVLMGRLAAAPRRRDFKTVPMVLEDEGQWDHEALGELMAYGKGPKQVWDNSTIENHWLELLRNGINTQVWSFKHPDFLAVSATHGTAHLALYDQATWDKYGLSKLAGGRFDGNTLILDKGAGADVTGHEDPKGTFSAKGNSIPTLMRRGCVFLACHNAIWGHAGKLIEEGANPDGLSHAALAADLTNHLIEGVVLTPGAIATVPELQQVGFRYAKS